MLSLNNTHLYNFKLMAFFVKEWNNKSDKIGEVILYRLEGQNEGFYVVACKVFVLFYELA